MAVCSFAVLDQSAIYMSVDVLYPSFYYDISLCFVTFVVFDCMPADALVLSVHCDVISDNTVDFVGLRSHSVPIRNISFSHTISVSSYDRKG